MIAQTEHTQSRGFRLSHNLQISRFTISRDGLRALSNYELPIFYSMSGELGSLAVAWYMILSTTILASLHVCVMVGRVTVTMLPSCLVQDLQASLDVLSGSAWHCQSLPGPSMSNTKQSVENPTFETQESPRACVLILFPIRALPGTEHNARSLLLLATSRNYSWTASNAFGTAAN